MLQPQEALSTKGTAKAGLGARLIAAVARLLRRAGRRGRRSQGLVGLSDHLLADIGMRRADLHAMVYARAPLSRVKLPQEDNVAAFDRQRSGRARAQPTLVADDDALDPAA